MLYGDIQTKFIILSTNVLANHFTHSSLHTQDRDQASVKGKFSLMWSKNLLKLYFVLQFENNMLNFENNR